MKTMRDGDQLRGRLLAWLLAVGLCDGAGSTLAAATAEDVVIRFQPGRMIQKELDVLYQAANQRQETQATVPQPLFFHDALRTLDLSTAIIRFNDQSELRLWELTRLEIHCRLPDTNAPIVRLQNGQIHVISRSAPMGLPVQTPQLAGVPKGTEFLVSVDAEARRTEVTMFDGIAELSDGQTNMTVRSGQQAIAITGQGIAVRPILEATNLVQWWIEYPAVLDPQELAFTPPEQSALGQSLAAYNAGNLVGALTHYPGYPNPPPPAGEAQKIYLATLFLSVGAVDKATQQLALVDRSLPAAGALRLMIAAVQEHRGPPESVAAGQFPPSASGLLALSYAHQRTNNLKSALAAARAATVRSPVFGFAWARVGELEFSFGRIRAAKRAIGRALEFTPENANAHALNGFLLAAQNRIPSAIAAFDRAIALDAGLGNAWLGRGLCRRHLGAFQSSSRRQEALIENGNPQAESRTSDWQSDLQVAAALEPRRSLFRSYLGKAFGDAGDYRLALKEFAYARKLDPNDPTPELYSALVKQKQNRVNEAVEDLEHSIRLNDNRAVYRSRMLLDQDRAVRGANLAAIYRDAGMLEVSANEAARAVNLDYANYSAHLFLANSYNERLNYNPQVNLRYETPRVSEYLVATLLAPVGAGVLSPTVSRQEYSKLFERDRLGLTSSTEYLSRGAWSQSAVQFGTARNTAYALEAYYQWDPGQRINNDLETLTLSARVKQQLTPDDAVVLQVFGSWYEFGDLAQHYDPDAPVNGPNPYSRGQERQEPIALAGYHHAWSPNSHTLVLASRLQDTLEVDNPLQNTLVLRRNSASSPVASVIPYRIGQDYRSDLEIYGLEAQQILQAERGALIFGGRYQSGHFDTRNLNTPITGYQHLPGVTFPPELFSAPPQDVNADFERLNGYAYLQWQVAEPLRLVGGVAYDRLTYPVNFRYAPITDGDETTDQVSPKAGLILTPWRDTILRAAYSQSLGGVSLDQSFQLEPSQVAGFNQSWRSLVPESVGGANSAERFETLGGSWEQRLPTRTYLALGGEWLQSDLDRVIGVFDRTAIIPTNGYIFQSGTPERLDFEERTLTATINQLVGRHWAFGARYRLSYAELDQEFLDIPAAAAMFGGFRREQQHEATLHQVHLLAIYNHPAGFFSQLDALWSGQQNRGDSAALPGDSFWQCHALAGYRFPRRQAELRLGILNLTGQDYRLNPLNLTSQLPRERTFFTSLRFVF